MLYTDNIGLKKPAYNEPADIADINENSDIIDREFGNRYLKSETYSVEQANNAIAQAIEALPNGLVYRGAVDYYNNLPSENNELGDTYSVKYQGTSGTEADGNEYAWGEYDGTLQWIKLGVNAYTKNEIDAQREAIESDILKAENDIAINRATLGVQCKNIFDIDAYQAILGTATRGTAEIVDNGIKITADKPDDTGKMGDAYTNPYLNHQNPYKIPVKPNTTYVFSWVADSNLQGYVYVFRNGLTSDSIGKNNQLLKSFSFTTNADTTFITVRFGVTPENKSITYTNIMIRPSDITDNAYEPYVPSVNERLVEVENNKMGYEYGCAYAKNDTNVGWFKVASFSCPAIGSTLRRATFFVTGVGGSNTGVLSVQVTSVSGTTPGIGAIACSWAYNQLTTSGGKYITNIPIDSFKAIGNLDGNMIRVELWCRIDNAYFVLKSRLLNFESRTDFLPVSEVEMYYSSTATTEEPTGAVNTISSYNLRKELDNLTARITALETALTQTQTE